MGILLRTGGNGRCLRAVLASAALVSVILSAPPSARAIVHGTPVAANDPYAHAVVAVLPMDRYDHPGACTGVLLTPRAVLTAAHCVTGDGIKGVKIVFDLKIGNSNEVAVTRTVVHPDFKDDLEKFGPADLAVVFLAPHDFPTEIEPLDRDLSFSEGEQFVLLGYGRSNNEDFDSSGLLRKAGLAATGYETQRIVEMHPLSDAWPCGGDSGGPVLRKDLSGHYAVSGIMSAVFSGPSGECLFKGAFMTPIHTYADWIATTLASGG